MSMKMARGNNTPIEKRKPKLFIFKFLQGFTFIVCRKHEVTGSIVNLDMTSDVLEIVHDSPSSRLYEIGLFLYSYSSNASVQKY